jgi:hemerythrin
MTREAFVAFFTWQDRFNLGIPEIDKDHKILADLITRLHDAYASGNPEFNVGPVFYFLVDYARTHFAREETLMREVNFPGLVAHIAAHEALASRIEELTRRYLAGDKKAVSNELLAFLHNWLHFHILEEDVAFRPYIKAADIGNERLH